MSKRARGYDSVIPQNNGSVYTDSDSHDDVRGCISGILLKRIEEETVDCQWQHRRDPIIQSEEHGLSVLVEYSQSVGSDGAYIYEIAARQHHQQVDDGTSVDNVVERMRRANADAAAVHIRRGYEQIPIIELQNSYYIEAYEKYRAHYDGEREQSQILVQTTISRKDRQPEQSIESRLAQIIPVSVSIEVDDAQRCHDDTDGNAVDDDHRQYYRKNGQPALHASDINSDGDNSTSLLNRLTWQCGFADCPQPHLKSVSSGRAFVYCARRHLKICHAIDDLTCKKALALDCHALFPSWTCDNCRKVFSSVWAYRDHQLLHEQ